MFYFISSSDVKDSQVPTLHVFWPEPEVNFHISDSLNTIKKTYSYPSSWFPHNTYDLMSICQ